MKDASRASPHEHPYALLFHWTYRMLAGFLVALPITQALGAPLRQFPEGSGLLVASGSVYLVEVIRVHSVQIAAAVRTSVWLFLLLGSLELAPITVLLVALSRKAHLGFPSLVARAAARFPALVLLSGATTCLQVIVLAISALPALALRAALLHPLGSLGADVTAAIALCMVLCTVGLIGSLEDLSRAALVCQEPRLGRAVALAWRAFQTQPVRIVLDWFTPLVSGIVVVCGVEYLVIKLHAGGNGIVPAWGGFLLHQLAILLVVYLRAIWICSALAHVRRCGTNAPRCVPSAGLVQRSG